MKVSFGPVHSHYSKRKKLFGGVCITKYIVNVKASEREPSYADTALTALNFRYMRDRMLVRILKAPVRSR